MQIPKVKPNSKRYLGSKLTVAKAVNSRDGKPIFTTSLFKESTTFSEKKLILLRTYPVIIIIKIGKTFEIIKK
jgi:hypothetical protein